MYFAMPKQDPTYPTVQPNETMILFGRVKPSFGTNKIKSETSTSVNVNTIKLNRIQSIQLAAHPSDGGRSGRHSSSSKKINAGSGVNTHNR
ncbi:hypothetical protein GN958_ATG12513 [Phytophthora infestans]|uniref:Uncharacterized protein n=1 Tax=Phytophthora infestans TaxID=4787 RepID=A0A8S9UB23_PHYIN|nr:hypothetical protein GN958_ATG12513 [Phytophthora infestans]